jgi:hypothetical protein
VGCEGADAVTHDSLADPVRLSDSNAVAGSVLEAVADAVSRLKYGVVQLTIHEGKVVQLDVTDRLRFR